MAALVWSVFGERTFLDALWLCLLIVGGVVCLGALNILNRGGSMDARAALGHGPEGVGDPGGQPLTGFGFALLVGAPLLLAGTLVEILA